VDLVTIPFSVNTIFEVNIQDCGNNFFLSKSLFSELSCTCGEFTLSNHPRGETDGI
jgi:hypothetical protein